MFMNYFSRLGKWYSICSEANAKPPAKTYVAQFSALYQIFLVLEYQVALSFSVFVLSSTSVLLPPSVSTLKLGVLITQIDSLRSSYKGLQTCIGQNVAQTGVKFEYLLRTTSWVFANFPPGSYHDFTNVNTLLDTLGSSYLSNDFFSMRSTIRRKVNTKM